MIFHKTVYSVKNNRALCLKQRLPGKKEQITECQIEGNPGLEHY